MAGKLGTLFQIYYRPSRALSTILDSGSLALAVIAAAALGLAMGEISRVVLIAVLFAPACIAGSANTFSWCLASLRFHKWCKR